MFKNRFGLPMNLQFFAADTGGEGGGNGEGGKGGDQNSDANENGQGDKGAEHTIPKSRFDEINTKYKETQSKLDELLKKQADADKERDDKENEDAAKRGEYENLYNKAKGDADKFKGDAKVAGERVQALEAVINSLLETKMQSVPEEFRDLIPANLTPEAKLAWVDAAEAKGLFGAKQSKANEQLGDATNPGNTQTADATKLNPMQMFLAGYGKR